ncbi:MAG TPA: hypothetical protein VMW61_01510 [Dehalococcoidales bacterium]|nr:hypothetical protein [Dehalococcoidales bacterium]
MPEDELKQDHSPEGDELEELKARIAELEGVVAEKEAALKGKDGRITEVEQVIAEKDSEVATLKQTVAELEGALNKAQDSLVEAVISYRHLVVQANPDIPEELISGDTIEAIDQSVANARELISRVKEGMEAEASKSRFPAGAPPRMLPDLTALSPREKIQYAIGGKN